MVIIIACRRLNLNEPPKTTLIRVHGIKISIHIALINLQVLARKMGVLTKDFCEWLHKIQLYKVQCKKYTPVQFGLQFGI